MTVLFADLADSTGLAEQLDPEALRKVLARHFEIGSQAIRRHGGAVEKYIGDAVMAVFGVPELHEDDALRAVRAASELREGVDVLNRELARDFGVRLALRIGVNTGEVVAGDASRGQSFVTGEPVVTAARLEQTAAPGEILMGEPTRRLVANAVRLEPLSPLDLKGKKETVTAWRLLELVPGAPPFVRRLDAPLVGREIELAQLETAFRRVVRERSLHLVTVLGPPGIGKTRLAQEVGARLAAEAQVLEGRCLAYGEGITFWPLRELILDLAGQGDPRGRLLELLADDGNRTWIVERLLGAVGLGDVVGPTEEIYAAVRKLLESLGQQRPLLVVVEDIHWAEAAFLDLVEHLADFTPDAPVLLLTLARPELLDERPDWSGGKRNATLLELASLTDEEAGKLLESLGAVSPVAPEQRAGVKEAAEGNPLFLEQMVVWLAEKRPTEGELPLPPTIQAVLAARLESLGPGERAVLERAAIVGKEFRLDEVLELLPPDARPPMPRHLQALVRKQFFRPSRSTVRGAEAFRFRHVLIQDAAYRSVAKELRAELHERFAAWTEEKSGEQIAEVEEIVAYHLDQAHRYRTELSPSDPRAGLLAQRAGERFASAGTRAVARGDVHAAASLLGRAASLLPRLDPRRVALLPDLGESLAEAGRLEEGRAVLHEAVEAARAVGNASVEWRALAADGWWRLRVDFAPVEEIGELAEEAIGALEQIGDESGLAHAWRLLGDVYPMKGDFAHSADALARAYEHAGRAGNRHERFESLAVLGVSLLWGPTPVDEAIRRLDAVRDEVGDDPPLKAALLRILGGFHALQGQVEEGRRLVDRSRTILEDLGFRWALAANSFVSAHVERLAGDLDAAEHELRNGAEQWRQHGRAYLSVVHAWRACGRALRRRGVSRGGGGGRHSLELAHPRGSRESGKHAAPRAKNSRPGRSVRGGRASRAQDRRAHRRRGRLHRADTGPARPGRGARAHGSRAGSGSLGPRGAAGVRDQGRRDLGPADARETRPPRSRASEGPAVAGPSQRSWRLRLVRDRAERVHLAVPIPRVVARATLAALRRPGGELRERCVQRQRRRIGTGDRISGLCDRRSDPAGRHRAEAALHERRDAGHERRRHRGAAPEPVAVRGTSRGRRRSGRRASDCRSGSLLGAVTWITPTP